jgi:hypothetical protein
MARIKMIVVLGIAFAVGTAAALDVGIGAFYAPARVVGYVDETREHSDKDFSLSGLKVRVSLAVLDNVNASAGFGYNDFIYREDLGGIEERAAVESIPMAIMTLGGDYALPVGPVTPFVGGGAALARETAEGYGRSTADWYGGLYAEAGARYHLISSLAVEVAPRYTFLFDNPVVAYDDFNVHGFVRSEHHSQLAELLVGVNYYF